MMSSNLDEVVSELLMLPDASRLHVAERLIASVSGFANEEVSAAWRDEIVTRVAEHERGDATGIESTDVFREARKQLHEGRQIPPIGPSRDD